MATDDLMKTDQIESVASIGGLGSYIATWALPAKHRDKLQKARLSPTVPSGEHGPTFNRKDDDPTRAEGVDQD